MPKKRLDPERKTPPLLSGKGKKRDCQKKENRGPCSNGKTRGVGENKRFRIATRKEKRIRSISNLERTGSYHSEEGRSIHREEETNASLAERISRYMIEPKGSSRETNILRRGGSPEDRSFLIRKEKQR